MSKIIDSIKIVYSEIKILYKDKKFSIIACILLIILWIGSNPTHGKLINIEIAEKLSEIKNIKFLDAYIITYYFLTLLIIFFGLIFLCVEIKNSSKIAKKTNKSLIPNISHLRLFMLGVTCSILISLILNFINIEAEPLSNTLQCDVHGDCFSWGEDIFISPYSIDSEYDISISPLCKKYGRKKYLGSKLFNADSKKSKEKFNEYLEYCPEDSEALVYKNNLEALESGHTVKLAFSAPISRKGGTEDSQSALRGVAMSQKILNADQTKPYKILIGIADEGYQVDDNQGNSEEVNKERKKSEEVAEYISRDRDILGVIGHFSSDQLESASTIYNNKNQDSPLAVISPISTAIRKKTEVENGGISSNEIRVTSLGENIFRTAYNDKIAAQRIINEIDNSDFTSKNSILRVSIIWDKESLYSESFKGVFESLFFDKYLNTGRAMISNSSSYFKSYYPENDSCEFRNSLDDCLNDSTKNYQELKDEFSENKIPIQENRNVIHNIILIIPSAKDAYKQKISDLVKLNRESKNSLPIYGSDGIFKTNYDSHFNGIKTFITWHPENDDGPSNNSIEEIEFQDQFNKIFNGENRNYSIKIRPDWRTASSYDAIQVFSKALENTYQMCNTFPAYFPNPFDKYQKSKCLKQKILGKMQSEGFRANGVNGKDSVRFDGGDLDASNTPKGYIVKYHSGDKKWKREPESNKN